MQKTNIVKLGGTSVDTVNKMEKIAHQVKDDFAGEQMFLVVSAMGKTTDRIVEAIENAREGKVTEPGMVYRETENFSLSNNLRGYKDSLYLQFPSLLKKAAGGDQAEIDRLHVSGEWLSAAFLSQLLKETGIRAEFIDFPDPRFPLRVRGNFGNATLDLPKSREMCSKNRYPRVVVFPGYGGVDAKGKIRTLGRGGSDTAAFGYGYALGADAIFIGTDVDGLRSAIVEGAKVLKEVSLDEARDIAFFGAKFPSDISLSPLGTMHTEEMDPYVCVVKSQNLRGDGTRIVRETQDQRPVKFVGGRDIVTYVVELDDGQRFTNELFRGGTDWFFLGGNRRFLSLGISERTRKDAERLIEDYVKKGGLKVHAYDENTAIVGMVGIGMKYLTGVNKKAYSVLGNAGINILTSHDPSDISIGAIINRQDRERAVRELYREFLTGTNAL